MKESDIFNYLGGELYGHFKKIDENEMGIVEEIRLRIGKPVLIYGKNQEFTITTEGFITKDLEKGYVITAGDILKTMELMSDFSLYALEDELKNGYITLPGGHRVGICGKAVVDQGRVKTISSIGSLNIRISHEMKGCANGVMKAITEPFIKHTLIISPPSCGKTTLLRDIVRQLSTGENHQFQGVTVGVVDERSEIAGCYLGVAQNDVGLRTDILDGCPKAQGMTMLLRSMSPKVIAVDEIGKAEDITAIEDMLNAGIKVIATVHGSSIDDILKKPVLNTLLMKNIFQCIIVLGYEDRPGYLKGIYDSQFRQVV